MAYNEFAYFYDEFNGEADYDTLFRYVDGELRRHEQIHGIVLDLGCGTGDLTLMLTQAGYDMIGVDQSEEMLAVLRDKADQLGLLDRLLLLKQDILSLDLYGTIGAAISTFDTYNHIPPQQFQSAIAKAGFFMEKGGVFVFDLNTPYKHQKILADGHFSVETPDACCQWDSHYDPDVGRVDLNVHIHYDETDESFEEHFCEYTYSLPQVRSALEQCGFQLERVQDGETFGPLREDSQRMILTAVKQYTQLQSGRQ